MTVIEPYNPHWPEEFAAIAARLHAALGGLALRIDHIGSTSVPGLAAKDVIDIQVTVQALAPQIVPMLEAAGFGHVPAFSQDHVPAGEDAAPVLWAKLFFRHRAGQRACHVHVRVQGKPNQQYALLFRDYLRAHPAAARSVELVKRELAMRHATDEDAYYAIKDPVYDLVWQAARLWALQEAHQTGFQREI